MGWRCDDWATGQSEALGTIETESVERQFCKGGPEAFARSEEGMNMSEKSFGREYVETLIGKAVVWGPPIAGAIILGPPGFAIGKAAAVAIAIAASGGNDAAPNESRSKEAGS